MVSDPRRILIVKPSSLGDIVHTLPLVHALKRSFPDCSLGWVVQDGFAGLLERDQAIDKVFPIHISSTSDPQSSRSAYLQAFKETLTTLRTLRGQFKHDPYDYVLDLHASFRSGLLGRTNPGGTHIGFKDARELNTFFQRQLVTVPDHVVHALDKNLLFADYLQCTVDAADFHICCSHVDEIVVEDFLQEQRIADGQEIVYANPAARWQTKFWPAQNWAELADLFSGQGRRMVFGGSSLDLEYIASITTLMRSRPVVTAGRFSLPESVALLQKSCLYIGLDSGPMHMAAMAAVPVVALFGPTHPDRVGPYGVTHQIVRQEGLDCLECRKRSCEHLSCMRGITVNMVWQAAGKLLINGNCSGGGRKLAKPPSCNFSRALGSESLFTCLRL